MRRVVKTETRARAFMEALREVDTLDASQPSATSIVWDVCIAENDRMRDAELGLLRSGLNALSRVIHRGLVAPRREMIGSLMTAIEAGFQSTMLKINAKLGLRFG